MNGNYIGIGALLMRERIKPEKPVPDKQTEPPKEPRIFRVFPLAEAVADTAN